MPDCDIMVRNYDGDRPFRVMVQDERGYRITFKAMKYPGMVISFK